MPDDGRAIFVGDSIHVGLAGHGLVEGGVENGDLRDLGAHDPAAGFDAGDVGGVVERGEGDAVLNGLHDVLVDENGGGEGLAAVDDAVADGIDLGHGLDDAVFLARELVDDGRDRFRMGREVDVLIEDRLVADEGLMLQMAADADALAKTFREDLLAVHIKELVFEGRASRVDN